MMPLTMEEQQMTLLYIPYITAQGQIPYIRNLHPVYRKLSQWTSQMDCQVILSFCIEMTTDFNTETIYI